jgi:hypothetical protein
MLRKTYWIAIATVCTLTAADLPYAGTWKLKGAAKTIEFTARGSDGLTVKIVDVNAICEAKFDGKDYPATGPTVPSGYTLAIRKIDERTFEMIQKMNSKALYTSTFTASPDGKTLTETDSANSVGEKKTAIYDRQ